MPDSMSGTIDIFGKKVKTKTAVLATGGILIGVIGIGWYRNKQAANAANAADAATTAANNIDPATGFVTGSAQDEAALAGMAQGTIGGGGGNLGAGEVIGYDGLGNPIYGAGTTNAPIGFTSNAQWGQAAETFMGSSGSDAIAAALGKYLSGSPLTPDQVTIVQQALAVEGNPPVAGPSGYPPSYLTGPTPPPTSPPPTGGGTTQVTVPKVTNLKGEVAKDKLQSVGLVDDQVPATTPHGKSTIVVAQNPAAGKKVNKGSSVAIQVKVV